MYLPNTWVRALGVTNPTVDPSSDPSGRVFPHPVSLAQVDSFEHRSGFEKRAARVRPTELRQGGGVRYKTGTTLRALRTFVTHSPVSP